MADDHDHAGALDLAHAAEDRVFIWAVALNVGYLLAEGGIGLAIGSLALIADAAHNLTDAAGLLVAWGAAAAARRGPTGRFSYGLGRGTILAALANAMMILVGVGVVVWEAVGRFASPPPVDAGTVAWVALVGIAVNAGTALLFMRRARGDLNARGAFLHMAADAAVSLAVVLSAVAMVLTGALWIDPAVAIAVSVAIGWTAWGLLRDAGRLALDAPPSGVDVAAVRARIAALPGVSDVHDLHVWALSTTRTALTAHLVMPSGHPGDAFLEDAARMLDHDFSIGHAALQIEVCDGPACRYADCAVA